MEDYKAKQDQVVEEQTSVINPVKNKNTFLLVWKIIVGALYITITAFLMWGLIDALNGLNTPVPDGQMNLNGLGFALFLIIVVLILGTGAYLINVILSIVGLVVSIKKQAGVGTKLYFILFIVLPIITEIVIFVLGKLLGANG